jgi:hypothetical protein
VILVIDVAASVISVCHWQLLLVVGGSSYCCSRTQATIHLRGGKLGVPLITTNIEINSIKNN